jgi:hypothetical protein
MKKIALSFIIACLLFTGSAMAQDSRLIRKHAVFSAPQKIANNCPIDYKKYENAQSYYINVNISTSDVMKKASQIKKSLYDNLSIQELESYSSSESSANLNILVPLEDRETVYKMFMDDPDITSLSKSNSSIGNSYMEASTSYYTYKSLLDSFGEIVAIMRKKNKLYTDECMLKYFLKQQMQNYKSNMDSYEKQINKVTLQIYISKSGK